MKDLSGKSAFITGGASGIGLGMARAFAKAGLRVALADIEPGTLAAAKSEINMLGVETFTYVLDVSDREAVKATAAKAADEMGPVHLFCANAGVSGPQKWVHEAEDVDWDWTLGVNLHGVINCMQAFGPRMIAHGEGGHIVNTASIAGVRDYPGIFPMALYATSKFAVVGLSQVMRKDLAPHGIGVSALCPDSVDTNLAAAGRNRPERFGGTFAPVMNPEFGGSLAAGLDPEVLGRRVLSAIENEEFYIFAHPHNRAQVEARHAELMAGFDALDDWLASESVP